MMEYALIPKFASAQATGKDSTAMSVSLVCITGGSYLCCLCHHKLSELHKHKCALFVCCTLD